MRLVRLVVLVTLVRLGGGGGARITIYESCHVPHVPRTLGDTGTFIIFLTFFSRILRAQADGCPHLDLNCVYFARLRLRAPACCPQLHEFKAVCLHLVCSTCEPRLGSTLPVYLTWPGPMTIQVSTSRGGCLKCQVHTYFFCCMCRIIQHQPFCHDL